MRRRVESAVTRTRSLAVRAPPSTILARLSLGLMILAAGVHKLLAPGAWAVYVVDWLAPWLVVSPTGFMLINGYLEIGFGLALVFATQGAFGDVLARDLGLAGLAWAVFVESVRE